MKAVIFKSSKIFLGILLIVFLLIGCESQMPPEEIKNTDPFVSAKSDIEAGRYLITVGGCNDCHTDGYLQTEGKIPEGDWLTGSKIGWRGPWGTTYASNLRIRVNEVSEDEWVGILHTRTAMTPMPWMNVNKMSEKDARSIYKYIKSLGSKGEVMPSAIPPDVEPSTPFLLLEPQNMN